MKRVSQEFPSREPSRKCRFSDPSESFHLLTIYLYFPLLVLKGINVTTGYIVSRIFLGTKKQMERSVFLLMVSPCFCGLYSQNKNTHETEVHVWVR